MAPPTVSAPAVEDEASSLKVHIFLFAAVAAAVFLAGGPQEANMGVFLVGAGLALTMCPPRMKLDWGLCLIASGVAGCASFALLPKGLISVPVWRRVLVESGVVPLASTVSISPGESLFWLAVVVVSAVIGLFTLAHPLRSRGRLAFASAGIFLCAAYAALAIYAHTSGWHYPFDTDPSFGFFPNRNHTAALLVTGAIVALGVLGVVFRGRHWLAGVIAAGGLATCVAALVFYSESRAGIVFLIFGTVLWVAGLGRAHWSKPLLISFAAVFLGAFLLFVASPGVARHRVLALVSSEQDKGFPAAHAPSELTDPPMDTRLLLFADTLKMVRDFPLTGTGLGTFRYVFPQYRERYLSESAAIHPESDWLMLAAEAGVPVVVLLVVGIAVVFRRVWPLRRHPYWPLRWGFICAALTALLHGMVDVPNHRAALGWWILLLAGVGFQVSPTARALPSRVQRILFLVVGLGSLALGIQLIRAEWFHGRPLPPFVAGKAQQEIAALIDKGDFGHAVDAAEAAIRVSPMADPLYFQLGVSLLHFETTEAQVDSIFQAQRRLNPIWTQIPIDQGSVWINIDPARTGSLWVEALERRERTARKERAGREGVRWLYRDLIKRAAGHPQLQQQLLAVGAGKGTEFILAWLEIAAPDLAGKECARLATDSAFLAGLDEAQRRRFLEAWYQRGDRGTLFEFIASNAGWERTAWPVRVHALVDAGKFEEVTRAVAGRYGISLDLPAGEPNDREPSDSDDPVTAFHFYWKKSNVLAAQRILAEARTAKTAAPEVWRLSTALAIHQQAWPAAWTALQGYLRASGLDALP